MVGTQISGCAHSLLDVPAYWLATISRTRGSSEHEHKNEHERDPGARKDTAYLLYFAYTRDCAVNCKYIKT